MLSRPTLVDALDAPTVAPAVGAVSPRAASRPRRLLSTVAVAAFATLACAGTASAESFAVTDTTDAPLAHSGATACESTHESTCTLRAAVQAAANTGGASTIRVPAGQYALTGKIAINGSSTLLTIAGAGAGETIITTNELSPALEVQAGNSLSLSDMSVENSGQDFGGAGLLNAGALTVTDCRLRHNVGGAIESTGSSVSVIDSTLEDNRASINGGALSVYDGSLTLDGDTITGNSATHGGKGGVLFDRENTPQPVEVIDSTIAKNEGLSVAHSGCAATPPSKQAS
jgi:hypothetical protein